MKVKTFKRMSKRFISTLLSVLMVVSLFTVCAVGSAVTVSAGAEEWDSDGVTNGKVTFDASATDWTDTVYLYIGRKYTYDKEQVYTARYEMTYNTTSNVWEYTVKWGPYTTFFFSTDSSKGNTGSAPDSIYSNIADSSKTALIEVADGFKLSGSGSTFTASGTAPYAITDGGGNSTGGGGGGTTTYYLDTTLFNYRNDQQIYDTGDNAKSTDEITMLAVDKSKPMSEHVQNGHMYLHYNNAVSTWFSSRTENLGYDIETGEKQNFTPLYEGNFHDLTINKDPWSNNKWYNWVMVANAANRYNHTASRNWSSNGDNIKTAAQNLVDDKMSNLENPREGTITQNGVELPQFSDIFITESKDSSGRYLQTKYPNLSFPVKATKNSHQNTWYSYNSLTDGNRYLNIYKESNGEIVREIKKGKVELTGVSGEAGYYPFNDDVNEGLVNSHGTRFDIDFVMPANGTGIVNTEALQFNFTGDDDLWVYIDGYLALDLGGSHNVASGSINLADKKSYIKTGVYNADYNSVSNKTGDGVPYNDGGKNTSDNEFESIPTEFSNELKASLADTTKTHTMTIFYMERGQYDSNLSFEFMLPQTNSLKIEQKIDTTAVNEGLLKETLNTADKDAHEVILQSNSISATKNDTAEIPVVSDFKRVDADGAYALLQHGTGDITNAKGVPFKNTTNGGMVTAGTTTFVWEDANANYGNSKKSFGTGTGIVGDNGEVDLLYNQTATFNDQFVLGSKFQLIPQNALKTFIVGKADSENPPATKETTRTVSKYYTQTSSITDNEGNPIIATDKDGKPLTGTPTDADKYYNFGAAGGISAKITASYTNTVKTGTIQFTKKLDAGTDSTTSFKFSVEFANIFGGNDTDAFDEYSIIYKIKDTNGTESEEKTYSTANGIVLKVGETAIIEGVPVDTTYRIIEESASDTSKNYSVASVTKGDDNVNGAADKLESTKGGIVATVGTVASDKDNIAHLDFNNTTKTTTVVYRFKDRNMTSGLPTSMEEHYTYFTRDIPGTITKNEAGRSIIEQYAPTIKNLMKTYSLNKDNIEFDYVLELDRDLRVKNPDNTYTSAEGIQNLKAGDKVIVATYTPVTRKYTVDVTCPDENGNYSSKAFTYEFNQLIKLGEIRAPKTYTANGTTYNFRYWAKLVNVDGTRASTYTPVSTNYSYSYRVTDHARIRAVYDKDVDFKQLEAPVVVDDADYNVSGPGSGYDASAAERVYDSYSKDVVKNSTVVSQDRTRVNVLFGAVGSKDIDKNITEVGYILLQKQGKYATDNLFSDDVLKTYVPNKNEVGKLLSNDLTIDGNTYKARRKSYKVDGNGYMQNPDTGEWEEKYVAGEVNLTNKNRVNIVFDIINDGSNLEKYYTCYTFMKRVDYEYDENGNKISDDMKEYIYVSETPAYFNLHEAEPYIQEVETGGQSYPVVSYVRDTSGMINDNAGNIKLSKQNIKDGQKLVITITPTNYVSNGKTMESKLKSLKIGTIEIAEKDFGSYTISKTDESVISIIFDDDSHLPKNYSSLEVTAIFDVQENNDYVTVDASEFISPAGRVNVSSDNVNYGVTASIKKGEKFYVQAVPNDGYEFTGWSDDKYGTKNPIQLNVTADGKCDTIPTPIFKQFIEIKGINYDHGIVQLSTSKNGTFTSSIKLEKGVECKFYVKAVPNTLYELTAWSDGTSAETNPIELTFNANGTYDPIPVPTFEEIKEKIIYFVDISSSKMSAPKIHIWGDNGSDADYSTSGQNLIEIDGTSEYTNNTYTGILYSYTYKNKANDYKHIKVHSGNTAYTGNVDITLTPGHIYAINYSNDNNSGNDTVTDIGVYNSADWRKYETVTINGNSSYAGGKVLVCATQDANNFTDSIKLEKGVATTFYAKAVPNSGYKFTKWNNNSTNDTIAVTLDEQGNYTLPTPTFVAEGKSLKFKVDISADSSWIGKQGAKLYLTYLDGAGNRTIKELTNGNNGIYEISVNVDNKTSSWYAYLIRSDSSKGTPSADTNAKDDSKGIWNVASTEVQSGWIADVSSGGTYTLTFDFP